MPATMATGELTIIPFVCEACGYGQAGDDGIRSPEAARGWDGRTTLTIPKGSEPVCPNLAVHAGAKVKSIEEVLREEIDSLKAEVAAFKTRPATKKKK